MRHELPPEQMFAEPDPDFMLASHLRPAFSQRSRRQIWKRDGGRSRRSGRTGRLECAHLDHSRRNPHYDDPDNGRLLTPEEHFLDHFFRSGRNGLSMQANEWALSMIFRRLPPEEQKEVERKTRSHRWSDG